MRIVVRLPLGELNNEAIRGLVSQRPLITDERGPTPGVVARSSVVAAERDPADPAMVLVTLDTEPSNRDDEVARYFTEPIEKISGLTLDGHCGYQINQPVDVPGLPRIPPVSVFNLSRRYDAYTPPENPEPVEDDDEPTVAIDPFAASQAETPEEEEAAEAEYEGALGLEEDTDG